MNKSQNGCLLVAFLCLFVGCCILDGCGCTTQPSIYEIKRKQFEYEKNQREDRTRRELRDYIIRDQVERGW